MCVLLASVYGMCTCVHVLLASVYDMCVSVVFFAYGRMCTSVRMCVLVDACVRVYVYVHELRFI